MEEIRAGAGQPDSVGSAVQNPGAPEEKATAELQERAPRIKLKPFGQKAGHCGAASLKMVLDYWGTSVSEQEIAEIAGTSEGDGTSSQGIVKAAEHFGFKVLVKERSTIADLRAYIRKRIPVIVDWFLSDDGHYSVVVDLDKKNIIMADPAVRKPLIYVNTRKMSIERFQTLWFDFPGKYIKEPKDLVLRLMIVLTPKDWVDS